MRQRPEGFLRGALVLTVTGLVVKLMGALYNPAIVRIFARFDGHEGNLGKALVGIPAVTYLIISSFSSNGFNIAVSRLVASRLARDDQGSALRAFRWSLQFMLAVGLLAAAGLYLAAPWLAESRGAPEAVAGYRAIAPAVFIVSVVCAFRGLFSGMQEQTPTGISQIFEQGLRIVTGIALVALLAPRAVSVGAAGANFAAVAGTGAAAIYLAWLYRRRSIGSEAVPPPRRAESPWRLLGELVALAVPVAVIGAYWPLIMEADNAMVLPQLQAGGMTREVALDFLGRLQNAFAIIGFPQLVSTGVYVALVPAVAGALAAGSLENARAAVATAYKLTLAVALPSAVGLALLARPVYGIVFGTTRGGEVLPALAMAVPFLMLQQASAGVLQGAGREWLTARNLLLGVVVKVGLNFWWAALPTGGDPVLAVRGAAHATTAGLAVTTLLNLWDVQRTLRAGFHFTALVLRPAAATAAMGLVVALVFAPLAGLLHSTVLAALVCIGLGTLVYGAVLLRLGGLSASDLERVPRIGRPAAVLLRRLRLLKG